MSKKHYLTLPKHYKTEVELGKILEEMSNQGGRWPSTADISASPDQKRQLAGAFSNGRIGFLLGSAGTGKSWLASQIFSKYNGTVEIVAFTGKAVTRINEILGTSKAITIHRRLGARPTGRGFAFTTDIVDPDLLIIDELSMISDSLLLSLLKRVGKHTTVLCVGDHAQLPPVSRGNVIWEIQQCLPIITWGELTEIHRSSGPIIQVCDQIRRGLSPDITYSSKLQLDQDISFCPKLNEAQIEKTVLELAREYKRGKLLVRNAPPNPYTGLQFIVSTNEEKRKYNTLLQEIFNPKGSGINEHFKVGDKVIVKKNSFVDNDVGEKVFAANGDIGKITKSEKSRVWVRIGGNNVLIPLGRHKGILDHAYAITCHSFQGSEASVVVVIISGSYRSKLILSREFIYTACSRARDKLIIIGDKPAFIQNIKKKRSAEKRKSFLSRRIMEYYEQNSKNT